MDEDVSVAIELRLPRRPEAARTARRSLDAIRDRVSEERLGDLRLLVSELVANSVRHAGPSAGPALNVRVHVKQGGQVRAEVVDRGEPFALREALSAQDDEGGRGLELMRRLADRWGVARNDENRVWFEFDPDPTA